MGVIAFLFEISVPLTVVWLVIRHFAGRAVAPAVEFVDTNSARPY